MNLVNIFLKFDRKSKKTFPGLIKVSLRDVNQLFNSMDPSPFEEQDIDADAEAFIESWAFEYPSVATLSLEIIVEQEPSPTKNIEFINKAIHNFYKHKAEIKGREFRQLMREGRVALLVGFFFLGLCFLASELLGKLDSQTFARFLGEGLLIVGWVSMWKPIQIYLYDWWPLLRKARIYAKMSRMKISLRSLEKKNKTCSET